MRGGGREVIRGLFWFVFLCFSLFHSEYVGANFGNNANSFVQVACLLI